MPLYLVRWPDRSVTLAKADGTQQLSACLDEIADPIKCRIKEYNGPLMLTFQLKDRPVEPLGTLEAVEDLIGRKADTRGDVDALVEDMARLLDGNETDSFSDVTFVLADGAQIRGHRAVLAARCDYFRKLFRNLGNKSARVELPDVGAAVFKRVARYLYTGAPDFAPPAYKPYQSTRFTSTEAQAKAIARMRPNFILLFEMLTVARIFGIENLAALIEIHIAQHFEGSFSRDELFDLINLLEGADAFDLKGLKSHCLHVLSTLTHQEHYMWNDEDMEAQISCLPPALRQLPGSLQAEVESARIEAGHPPFSSYVIRQAVMAKDKPSILRYIEEKKSLSEPAYLGCLLHFAVGRHDLEFLRFFLGLGPHINFQDANGNSALHIAAGLGDPKIIELLIEQGAKANTLDSNGKSPLDRLAEARRSLRAFRVTAGFDQSPNRVNFLKSQMEEEVSWVQAEALLERAQASERPEPPPQKSPPPLCAERGSSGKHRGSGVFAFDSMVVDRWWQNCGTPEIGLEVGQQTGSAGEGAQQFMDALFQFMAPHTSRALHVIAGDDPIACTAEDGMEAIVKAVEQALVHDFEGDQPRQELDESILRLPEALERAQLQL